MKIVVGNFQIRHCSEGVKKFDLHILKKRQKGKKMGEVIIDNFAYGISFERCVEIIIHETVAEDNTIEDLKGYLEEYKKISESVLNQLKDLLSN